MIQVSSFEDFKTKSAKLKDFWLFIYKSDSEKSMCAFDSLQEATNKKTDTHVFYADVTAVKDIHSNYNVETVPTLLGFENSEFKGVYKGCNDESYYTSLFEDSMFSAAGGGDTPKQKSVTVYSTPTCSWCTRLKDYLKDNKIKFRDIDVSKDQKAAEDMVKRSGQQGVPQSLIGGQVIVGFDKAKIDSLLGLQ